MVGHVVDFDPFNGLAGTPRVPNDLDVFFLLGGTSGDAAVAVHAGIQPGDHRLRSFTVADVAVAARDLVLSGVGLVAERDPLGLTIELDLARVGGTIAFPWIHTGGKPDQKGKEEKARTN